MGKEQLCSKMVFGQLGVLSKINKIQQNWLLYYSARKKPQQWSLYEVIKDILPFVLNTKRPLSDIWLLSYEQNSFGCFFDKIKVLIFFKNTKNCFDFISATKYHQDPFSAPKLNIQERHFQKTFSDSFSPHIKNIFVSRKSTSLGGDVSPFKKAKISWSF